jgi:hypothetical protein
VVEALEGMAHGTLGFRAWGKLEADDFREVIMPPVHGVFENGGELRVVFVLEDDFEAHDPRALWEEIKADFEIGVEHRDSVKRTAVATDLGWVGRWMAVFGWMSPGEIRAFALGELDEAKAWLAA